MAELVQAGPRNSQGVNFQGLPFMSMWTSPHSCLSFATTQKHDSKGLVQEASLNVLVPSKLPLTFHSLVFQWPTLDTWPSSETMNEVTPDHE